MGLRKSKKNYQNSLIHRCIISSQSLEALTGKSMENSLYMEVYSWDMLGQSSMKHNDGFSSTPRYQRVLHVFLQTQTHQLFDSIALSCWLPLDDLLDFLQTALTKALFVF